MQYNAVMLISILANNPGPTFTRNLDNKFATTVRELLRQARDPSVQQFLRETLQHLSDEKAYDTNLAPLLAMWQKEKTGPSSHFHSPVGGTPGAPGAPAGAAAAPPGVLPVAQAQQNYFARPHRGSHRGLPPPLELAARIEEARTSAKLLMQLVQSSGPGEIATNALVKEFAERCQAAQRSVQAYISCENPAPDDDTLQTLIETDEQLSLAASRHQRAILQARRATTTASPSPPAGMIAPMIPSPPVPAAAPAPTAFSGVPSSNGTAHDPQSFYNNTPTSTTTPINFYSNNTDNNYRANQNTTSPTSTYSIIAPTPITTVSSGVPTSPTLSRPFQQPELPARAAAPPADDPFSDAHAASQNTQQQYERPRESQNVGLVSPVEGTTAAQSGGGSGVTYRY